MEKSFFEVFKRYNPDEKKRRLLESARDVRVIDVALRYGYDSPDSFARAFTRFQLLSGLPLDLAGITIDLYDLNGNGIVFEDGYQHMLKEVKPYLNDLTRIVVTHALDENLLKRYDCVLALKNGSIIEYGNFDELMEKKGYFYSLFTISQ